MIVTATLDLSEAGRTDLTEDPVEVLIYASDQHDIEAAFKAISSVRLIREGHVFETRIHHSLNAHAESNYTLLVDRVTGEVISRH